MVMTGGGIVAAKGQPQTTRQSQDSLPVERLTQGERSSFDEIVTRHQKWVARLAYRLLGWPEDVVQEVFLSVLKNLAQFRGEGSLKTWLTTITVNTCRSWRRKKIVRLKYLRRARARTPLDLPEHGEPILDTETVTRVRRTIQRLPTGSREVIVLRYLEDLPITEIAQVLHISRNAVNLRLNRARTRLREKLADLIEE
jgi:RNA polymerase sigma factor (sigma-70 family)